MSRDARKEPAGSPLGFVWGVGGVVALLLYAIVRLVPVVRESLREELTALHVAAYLVSIATLAYSEGYRAFQRGFSPRVVARAHHIAHRPTRARILFAPAIAMGLFDATRRRRIVAWCTTLGVAALVVIVSRFDQPWRGIVDAGVVAGLGWGVVTLLYFAGATLAGRPPRVPTDFVDD